MESKTVTIEGKLSFPSDLSHEQALIKLYKLLKEEGFFLSAKTKPVE